MRAKSKAGEGILKLIFLAVSPLIRPSFARVFAASPLSGAPDKTAMLRRPNRHGDDNSCCCFRYSCPSASPRTSASVRMLFEALCYSFLWYFFTWALGLHCYFTDADYIRILPF